jgi:hypothetical protein
MMQFFRATSNDIEKTRHNQSILVAIGGKTFEVV